MATNNSANISSSGIISYNGTGTFFGRTITGTANQIGVTNGDGIAGNPTFALTSTIYVSGISFDSGTNVLSSYSAGTFTPTITGSSTNPTVTYSTQSGIYQRIGSKVLTQVRIVLTAYTGGTGNLQLSGLPFTTLITANSNSYGALTFANVTFQALVSWYIANAPANSTFVNAEGSVTATTSSIEVVTNLSATSAINYNLAYNV